MTKIIDEEIIWSPTVKEIINTYLDGTVKDSHGHILGPTTSCIFAHKNEVQSMGRMSDFPDNKKVY